MMCKQKVKALIRLCGGLQSDPGLRCPHMTREHILAWLDSIMNNMASKNMCH